MLLFSSVAGTTVAVEDTFITIEHYTHAGCSVGGVRYLPTFAGTGLTATFRDPEGRNQCVDMIGRARQGCGMATHFQSTNPAGRPWAPGEKDPRCLDAFKAEVPTCIAHYDNQRSRCGGSAANRPNDQASKRRSRTGDLLRNMASGHDRTQRDFQQDIAVQRRQDNQRIQQLGQAAILQGSQNLMRDLTNLAARRRSAAGWQPGQEGDDERCQQVAARIADNWQEGAGVSGACGAGREQLRMLDYFKSSLSAHGCYGGEYDQSISETRNYIAEVC